MNMFQQENYQIKYNNYLNIKQYKINKFDLIEVTHNYLFNFYKR